MCGVLFPWGVCVGGGVAEFVHHLMVGRRVVVWAPQSSYTWSTKMASNGPGLIVKLG